MYNDIGELYLQRKYNKLVGIEKLLENKIDKREFYKGKHFSPRTEFKKGNTAWKNRLKMGGDTT